MKETPGDIILHMCTKNYGQMTYGSWDMVCDRWTDRQTDGQKKWHIDVGAQLKKKTDFTWNPQPQRNSVCRSRLTRETEFDSIFEHFNH